MILHKSIRSKKKSCLLIQHRAHHEQSKTKTYQILEKSIKLGSLKLQVEVFIHNFPISHSSFTFSIPNARFFVCQMHFKWQLKSLHIFRFFRDFSYFSSSDFSWIRENRLSSCTKVHYGYSMRIFTIMPPDQRITVHATQSIAVLKLRTKSLRTADLFSFWFTFYHVFAITSPNWCVSIKWISKPTVQNNCWMFSWSR